MQEVSKVRKVAKLLCFVLALSLYLHSCSFHASRLAIIKAYCVVPEGCFALWNNHEPLNNASLQLYFNISWTNFARPSAPGTTTSFYDHTPFHNFSPKATYVSDGEGGGEPKNHISFHLTFIYTISHFASFFIFDIPNIAVSKYSQSDVLFFCEWREVFPPFSFPPTAFCFKVNFVLCSTRNTSPRALETQKEYQFSFCSKKKTHGSFWWLLMYICWIFAHMCCL